MRRLGPVVVAALAVVSAVSFVPLSHARADDPPAPVTLSSDGYAGMSVDDVDHVEFVSSWGDALDVINEVGAKVTSLKGFGETAGLVFSPSRDLLYVARPAADAVAVLNAHTFASVGSITLPAGSTPDWVALAGGRLWIGAGGDTRSLLFSADPAGSGAATAETIPPADDALGTLDSVAPYLMSPGESGTTLMATDFATESPALDVFQTQGTGLTFRKNLNPGSHITGVAFSPDGSEVTLAEVSYAYLPRLRLADLSPDGSYDIGGVTAAGAAITADGKWLVSGTSAETYATDRSHEAASSGLSTTFAFGLGVSGDGSEEYSVQSSGDTVTFTTGPGPATGQTATPEPGPLQIGQVGDFIPDFAHGRLYLSSPDDGVVDVMDLSGNLLTQIPGMFGAEQLALSPDGTELFAALGGADEVAVIDTAASTVSQLLRTNSELPPSGVAVTGGRVWAQTTNGMGSKPLSDLGSAWVPSGVGASLWLYSSPAKPGMLFGVNGEFTDQSISSAYLYNLSGTSASEAAMTSIGSQAVTGAISPDGSKVAVTCYNPPGNVSSCYYDAWSPTTGGTPTSALVALPQSITWGNDGKLLYVDGDDEMDPNTDVEILSAATGAVVWHTPPQEYSDYYGKMIVSPDDRTAYLLRASSSPGTEAPWNLVSLALPDEGEPTTAPTVAPTPTRTPSAVPSSVAPTPSHTPTAVPSTVAPTPSRMPTAVPSTVAPTPSHTPSAVPSTVAPTPSRTPTAVPSAVAPTPSRTPTAVPSTVAPTPSRMPTAVPSTVAPTPSRTPSAVPSSVAPPASLTPTVAPTLSPAAPSPSPTPSASMSAPVAGEQAPIVLPPLPVPGTPAAAVQQRVPAGWGRVPLIRAGATVRSMAGLLRANHLKLGATLAGRGYPHAPAGHRWVVVSLVIEHTTVLHGHRHVSYSTLRSGTVVRAGTIVSVRLALRRR